MKKKRFIALSVILTFCLAALFVLPLTAQQDMTVSLSCAAAKPGKQVSLALSLKQNPGVAALYVRLSYDPALLTLNGVRDNALLEDFAYVDNNGAAVISFEPALYNNTAEGVLAYLDFTVASDAPAGDAAVRLLPYENGVLNKDTDLLSCMLESGVITVLPGGEVYSDTLGVDQETRQIGLILPGATVGEVKEALDEDVTVAKNGVQQDDNAPVATGMTVRFGEKVYTLVVTGDANGDAVVDENDLNAVKSHLLAQGSPEGVFFAAADVSGDGRVTITDFLLLKSYLAGKTALAPRSV